MKNLSGSKTLESMSQAIWYNRWTLAKFSKYLNGQILEVGCGIGNFTKFLIKYGQVTAIDINKDYIRQAKKNVADEARIGFGDIEKGKYFFETKEFNTTVCINVLEHIKNDEQALKNIYKLLASDGVLIVLVPAHSFLFNFIDQSIGHLRRYEKDRLLNIIGNCGFEILKARRLNFIGSIGWYIAGKFFKDKQINENKITLFNLISPIFLLEENVFEPLIGTSILVVARKVKK